MSNLEEPKTEITKKKPGRPPKELKAPETTEELKAPETPEELKAPETPEELKAPETTEKTISKPAPAVILSNKRFVKNIMHKGEIFHKGDYLPENHMYRDVLLKFCT